MAEAPERPTMDKTDPQSLLEKENVSSKRKTDNNVEFYYGIEAINRALNVIYPPETSLSIVTSPTVKIWEKGAHPLDYIKIFSAPGDASCGILAHWHYVTYGFSDLHGDGRVYDFTGRGQDSGYGFEVTFRVRKESSKEKPPVWPITLLNNLSHYVWNADIKLTEYDHIPWPVPINKPVYEDDDLMLLKPKYGASPLSHLLLVEDPQILNLDTPHGTVKFLQAVGITKDEFRYGRIWKAHGIIDELLEHPQVGAFLVTDVRRRLSVFDLNPLLQQRVLTNLHTEGSWMGQVTAHVCWKEVDEHDDDVESLTEKLNMINMNMAAHAGENNNDDKREEGENDDEMPQFRITDKLFLEFDASAGELLHLMVIGRLKLGRSFMFMSVAYDLDKLDDSSKRSYTIEFVPYNDMVKTYPDVNDDMPAKVCDKTKHAKIFCSKTFIDEMEKEFEILKVVTDKIETLPLHFTFNLPKLNLHFSVYGMLPSPRTE